MILISLAALIIAFALAQKKRTDISQTQQSGYTLAIILAVSAVGWEIYILAMGIN